MGETWEIKRAPLVQVFYMSIFLENMDIGSTSVQLLIDFKIDVHIIEKSGHRSFFTRSIRVLINKSFIQNLLAKTSHFL